MDKYTELIWYLAGENTSTNYDEIYSKEKKKNLPPIASPISMYINEVNRFLFDGGINVSMSRPELDKNEVKKGYVDEIIQYNSLQSKLYSIWETGVIEGEVLIVPRLETSEYYKFDFYPKSEFTYSGMKEQLEVNVEKMIYDEKEDEYYVFKLDITPNEYINYPLVKWKDKDIVEWDKMKKKINHDYKFTPVIIIKNREKITEDRGLSDFNYAAIKQACSIILLIFDGLENVHLFGNPYIISPDPEDTLHRIQNRVQVLESSDTEGKIDSLSFNSISSQHLQLIDTLNDEFAKMMGIKNNLSGSSSNDLSSLTLRIQNSTTISKAESKWRNYVDDGIKPLLENVLIMASVDGILPSVNPELQESFDLNIVRNKEYFPPSPSEKLKLIEMATSLTELGVDRVEALKETIWSNLSSEEIESKLNRNIEDI